ncbi:MAG TPA: repressor LexA [Anaerolineae bacterium]|nr:repressor LexA [Anaerolineae bacterium]
MPRRPSKELRPRQKAMLEFIRKFIEEHDYPPTIREIGAAVGISSTSVVNYNLNQLEEKGYIVRNREVSRGLRLVKATPGRTQTVPFYGEIAAGAPLPVPEDPTSIVDYVSVPMDMLPSSGDVFALRVKGQSMIDALVDDGDIVLVRSQPTVETREMAVVEILEPPEEAGATLKYFYHHGDHIELRPANPDPAYQPLIVAPDQVRVHGKVIGVIRRYQ